MSDLSRDDLDNWLEEQLDELDKLAEKLPPDPIEFPTTAKQADTDKPKRKSRKKKSNQLDTFGG